MVTQSKSICANVLRYAISLPQGFTQGSQKSQTTPANPASRANSHTLTATPRQAEDPISSGVPPPLPLLVDVDVPALEVEVFVFDVLVEVSEGDSGITVIPTTATLVVVDSGMTVVGTTIVVEVVAAWRVEGTDDVELIL